VSVQTCYTESTSEQELIMITQKTPIAVLGTLADLHREPIRYNLACLTQLVEQVNPDLLCAEVRQEAWEQGAWDTLPIEYREALIPLTAYTNIVIVPIQGPAECSLCTPQAGPWLGLRRSVARHLDGLLRWLQRQASGPDAINSGAFGHLCHTICLLEAWNGGAAVRQAWQAANRALLENIVTTVRRDPGVRVLVTVDCRRRHQLVAWLKRVDEVALVDVKKL
jgi:hypothetical protein